MKREKSVKKTVKFILKLAASAIISAAVLCTVCYFYYNLPVHFTNEKGYTDYLWEADKQYYKCTEGYGSGKTNNEGLLNAVDYTGQKFDVLLVGSSQFEGQCVKQSETIASYYNEMSDGSFAYSMGVSGHDFCRCVQNLDKALERYQPKECTVLEISNLLLKEEDMDGALNGEIAKLNSVENKYIVMLEKIPLLRHLYNQMDNVLHKNVSSGASEQEEPLNTEKLEALIQYVSSLKDKYGTRIVIVYHQTPELVDETQKAYEQEWSLLCSKYGIEWLNVLEDFESSAENGVYCYGFINTLPQKGHLNKNGNKIIAERLCEAVSGGKR